MGFTKALFVADKCIRVHFEHFMFIMSMDWRHVHFFMVK